MNAYSEDLRKKVVDAVERRGMKKSEAAYVFGISISTVKRYARMIREGRPLTPKKSPGKRPKVDERARKLLEADLEERPAAKLSERCEFLERIAGVRVSEPTVSRLLHQMRWTRKKGA